MKILHISDLHLEINKNFELNQGADEKNTVLVLAGDIISASSIGSTPKKEYYEKFFADISKRFKKIFYVYGNHEYYGGSLVKSPHTLTNFLHCYDNISHGVGCEIFEDVNFIYCTMWTDYDNNNPLAHYNITNYMNDYRQIRTGSVDEPYLKKITSTDIYLIHKAEFEFIKNNMKYGMKNVIITHHAPWRNSIKSDIDVYSFGFFSDKSDFILDNKDIKLWIHGHTHQKYSERLDHCLITTNPHGYPMESSIKFFNHFEIVEI